MRRRLSSWSLTPAGGALLLVLAAAVTVLLLGPKHDEAPALIVIVVVLFMFVSSANPGGATIRSRRSRSLSARREEFRPRERVQKDEAEAQVDESLWQRERERRNQKNRG